MLFRSQEVFKAGSEVGFKYKNVAFLDLSLGSAVNIELFNRAGKNVQTEISLSWLLSCLLPCQKQRDDYRSGISEEKRPYEGLPQAVRRISICLRFPVALNLALNRVPNKARAIPHNSKCRYGERGAADAKPKAQIILDAAKVSAAGGGCSEPKQGQRSQSARGFCPRCTMRVPQPDIIEHFGNTDAVPQLPERCLSRKAGIVRCCPR